MTRLVSSRLGLVAIGTLAIGIGLPTAVYSVFDAVLVEPLPFSEPARVVRLEIRSPGGGGSGVNNAVLTELQGLPEIEGVAGYAGSERAFTGGPKPQIVRGAAVTPAFFHVLGVSAAMGAVFGPQGSADGSRPIVISHRLWLRRFAADPGVIGQTLRVDAQELVITGVMPDRFRFPEDAEYWEVLRASAAGPFGPGPLNGFARVRSSDPTAARSQVDTLNRRHPGSSGSAQALVLLPMLAETDLSYRPTLTMVLMAAVLVLFIACANVAHLLLATSASRGAELSLKHALGARPSQLARELLVEASQLALVAGIAGAFVSWLLLSTLPQLGTLDIPRLDQVRMNWRVLLFASIATTASVAWFGSLPGWMLFRQGLAVLPTQRSTAGPTAAKWSRAIIAGEVAVALVLLAGSLFVATGLYRLLTVDVGFDGRHTLVSALRPSFSKYVGDARAALIENVMAGVRAQPGIDAVAAISPLPLGLELARPINVTATRDGVSLRVTARRRYVSAGALTTLGGRMLQGREFTAMDKQSASVVVNESLARRLWPDETAVGRTLRVAGTRGEAFTIIGVAGDIRGSLRRIPEPEVYLNEIEQAGRDITLVVRTPLPAARAEEIITAAVQAVDRDQPVTSPVTFDSVMQQASQYNRFHAAVFGVFGGFAIALAATGILGVVAYSVVRRTREIGVRVALGARPRQLIMLFVRELTPAIGIGLFGGCLGILSVSDYLVKTNLLFNVTPTDPSIYLAGVVGIAIVALIAAIVPARSASRVDPIVALRVE
jgi:putative ABC transport system permease protein